MKSWLAYYNKHKDSIERWILQFTPQLWEQYQQTPKNKEALSHILNECWWQAPDSPKIRTDDFFHVTDLLDESWRDAK